MSSDGRQDTRAAVPHRLVLVAGALLLALDVALTASFYNRLPQTIAVHWSLNGQADNAGHRDLAWLLPMLLAFFVGLGAVSRRHAKPHERGVVAGCVLLAALYMFSVSLLLLLANVGNEGWQQGSVAGRWMLLVLTAPALLFAAGVFAYRALSDRARSQ